MQKAITKGFDKIEMVLESFSNKMESGIRNLANEQNYGKARHTILQIATPLLRRSGESQEELTRTQHSVLKRQFLTQNFYDDLEDITTWWLYTAMHYKELPIETVLSFSMSIAIVWWMITPDMIPNNLELSYDQVKRVGDQFNTNILEQYLIIYQNHNCPEDKGFAMLDEFCLTGGVLLKGLEAKSVCEAKEAHLPIVTSGDEAQKLYKAIYKHSQLHEKSIPDYYKMELGIWLGLHRSILTPENWIWDDGMKWDGRKIINGYDQRRDQLAENDCVAIRIGNPQAWRFQSCRKKNYAFCQRTWPKSNGQMRSNFEDCWNSCGSKGGSCKTSECNGHCCSATKTHLNGNCPILAVQFLNNNAEDKNMHQCVTYR